MNLGFTIATNQYLPQACVCAQSFKAVHPDCDFQIVLMDELKPDIQSFATQQGLNIIEAHRLNLPKFQEMLTYYGPFEMSVSLKPVMARYFASLGTYSRIIFADSDLFFLHPIPSLQEEVSYAMSLTPHQSLAAPLQENLELELGFLKHGIYNTGYFDVNARHPEAITILSWWVDRLEKHCLVKVSQGIYVDQKWLDTLPIIFPSVNVDRDLGLNVALWNLNERKVSVVEGKYYVNQHFPLVFFHFSGFRYANPQFSETHPEIVPNTEVQGIFQSYRKQLQSVGVEDFRPQLNLYKPLAGKKSLKTIIKSTLKAKLKRLYLSLGDRLGF